MKRRTIEIDERRKRGLDLFLQGFPYRVIGEELGISHMTVSNDITARLKELAHEENGRQEHALQVFFQRQQKARRVLWPIAEKGRPEHRIAAAAELRKIDEFEAKLRGIEAPTKLDVATGGERHDEYRKGIDQLSQEEQAALHELMAKVKANGAGRNGRQKIGRYSETYNGGV